MGSRLAMLPHMLGGSYLPPQVHEVLWGGATATFALDRWNTHSTGPSPDRIAAVAATGLVRFMFRLWLKDLGGWGGGGLFGALASLGRPPTHSTTSKYFSGKK